MDLLLLLLLSHLLGDFILQNDKMAKEKDEVIDGGTRYLTLLKHGGIHFILNGAALLFLFYILHENCGNGLLIVLMLILSHLVIDWCKPYLMNIGISNKALLFVMDQLTHIGIILLIVVNTIDTQIFTLLRIMKNANFFEQSIFSLIILIVLTTFTNIFIRNFLDTVKQTENNNNDDNNNTEIKRGRYIGALERILAFLAVYTGSYSVLVGIFATKTAIRFKEFDDKDFAEYYFIGTSLSALIAIFISSFCRWLL